MNILMLTNVYSPLVGGIPRSVEAFAEQFRSRGHRVVVVAPEHDEAAEEDDVVRYPSLQKVFRQRYSLPLPVPGTIRGIVEEARPDVIHSHHPFLLGDTAQLGASLARAPLVYTHHTRYRLNAELGTAMPEGFIEFLMRLIVKYCNGCDAVVAPSRGMANLLAGNGVTAPVEVIPTGLRLEKFAAGDGAAARARWGIPQDAYLVGSVSRLEPEKNPVFLATAVAEFMLSNSGVHFLMVGDGHSRGEIEAVFAARGLTDRLHMPGTLENQDLADAYHAFDVFAYASKTETQGLVVGEALAAGRPVVALKATGVEDFVSDGENGRQVDAESLDAFVDALRWMRWQSREHVLRMRERSREIVRRFSIEHCSERMLGLYQRLIEEQGDQQREVRASALETLRHEWLAWKATFSAAAEALTRGPEEKVTD